MKQLRCADQALPKACNSGNIAPVSSSYIAKRILIRLDRADCADTLSTYTHTVKMATKTISIDVEAYRRLKSVTRVKESFSEAIKRVIQAPIDLNKWMDSIEKDPLSDEAVDAVEAIVSQRRDRRNRRRVRGAS